MSNHKINLAATWSEIRQKVPLSKSSAFLQKALIVKGKLCISLIVRPSDGLPGLLVLVPEKIFKPDWRKAEFYGVVFDSPQKVDNSYALPILLKDEKAEKIFKSLVHDLISCVAQYEDESKIFKCLKEKISLWKRFFQKRTAKLDEDQTKGLFGEIYVLNQIAKTSGNDYALNSWKGPIPETYDFQLAKYRVEVKTWSNTYQPQIYISDINQIIYDTVNPLYLSVIQISKDLNDGKNLGEIVDKTLSLFTNSQKDLFLSLLSDAGYLVAQRELYAEKYSIVKQDFYLVGKEFPRIEYNQISPCISSVKYCINLNGISEYLVESPL
jgi:hypothetical protein